MLAADRDSVRVPSRDEMVTWSHDDFARVKAQYEERLAAIEARLLLRELGEDGVKRDATKRD